MANTLDLLAAEWKKDAETLRRYGAEKQAALLEQLAGAVEAAALHDQTARVGLDAAVALSGFTRGHLRRLMKSNLLTNLGTDDNPEFLVASLPRKAGKNIANEKVASKGQPPANFPWQAARAALFDGGQAHATSKAGESNLELSSREEGQKSGPRV